MHVFNLLGLGLNLFINWFNLLLMSLLFCNHIFNWLINFQWLAFIMFNFSQDRLNWHYRRLFRLEIRIFGKVGLFNDALLIVIPEVHVNWSFYLWTLIFLNWRLLFSCWLLNGLLWGLLFLNFLFLLHWLWFLLSLFNLDSALRVFRVRLVRFKWNRVFVILDSWFQADVSQMSYLFLVLLLFKFSFLFQFFLPRLLCSFFS